LFDLITETTNRPERRNAFSPQTMMQFGEAWNEFCDDELPIPLITNE